MSMKMLFKIIIQGTVVTVVSTSIIIAGMAALACSLNPGDESIRSTDQKQFVNSNDSNEITSNSIRGDQTIDQSTYQSQNDPELWLKYMSQRDYYMYSISIVVVFLLAMMLVVSWRTRYSQEKARYEGRKQ